MWYNHLKIAARRLVQNKSISVLKISGLAIGIAVSILLVRYIEYQWQFDRFHENADNIFRIQTDQITEGTLQSSSAMTYAAVSVEMQNTLPEVKNQTRLGKWIANDVVFSNGERVLRENEFFFAEPSLFEMFSFKLIKGNPQTALSEPFSIVLTEKNASILFGEEEPMGKEVLMEGRQLFKVTGIIENPPPQSHIQYGNLGSYSILNEGTSIYGDQHWDYPYVYAYVQLDKNSNPKKLESDLNNIAKERKENISYKDQFKLQALKDIHLYSNLQYEMGANGNGKNLWILLSISFLILLLGWLNHFNIYTANAFERIKTYSLRKIIGANRKQLIAQISIETLLDAIIGIVLGLSLINILEPFILQFFEIELAPFSFLFSEPGSPSARILVFIFLIYIIGSILPAIVLSGTSPKQVLNDLNNNLSAGINLRKAFSIFQFAIIIILLVGTSIIFQQTQFMQQKDLGLSINNIHAIKGPLGTKHFENLNPYFTSFVNEVEALPSVESISFSREIPGNNIELVPEVELESDSRSFAFKRLTIGKGWLDTYELPLLTDTDQSIHNFENFEKKVIINEAALNLLGFKNPNDALKKQLNYYDWNQEIVGVVSNHHQRSAHHPYEPMVFDLFSDASEDGYFSIKLSDNVSSAVLSQIETIYKEKFPNTTFEHFPIAEHYANQYRSDLDFRNINLAFTIISVLIAVLGLLGLSIILMKKKTKEIGIRKVLGATLSHILYIISKDFFKIIAMAFLIGTPVAWYLLNEWLLNFNFRIDMQWWVFGLAGLVALLIALLTICSQALKVAMDNPVEALRYRE